MASECEANRGIAGHDPLTFCWCLEEGPALLDTAGAFTLRGKRQSAFGAGHLPVCKMPIPTQLRQRPCRRQCFQVTTIQRCASTQILHTLEPPFQTRDGHAPCALLG